MSKRAYPIKYTQEEIDLASKLYTDDFQLEPPINMLLEIDYLNRARAALARKDIHLTDDLGYVMPLHSVIAILSSYLTLLHIDVHATTYNFINELLKDVPKKTH
jgi:hypothetical protein